MGDVEFHGVKAHSVDGSTEIRIYKRFLDENRQDSHVMELILPPKSSITTIDLAWEKMQELIEELNET